jgi:hypothetical protein
MVIPIILNALLQKRPSSAISVNTVTQFKLGIELFHMCQANVIVNASVEKGALCDGTRMATVPAKTVVIVEVSLLLLKAATHSMKVPS